MGKFLLGPIPYRQQKRKYGEGDIRLDTSLDFEEGIYDFAFITQLNNKILTDTIDVINGKTVKENEDEEIRDRELEQIKERNAEKDLKTLKRGNAVKKHSI